MPSKAAGLRAAAKLVPYNWLDPLLTGPTRVVGDPPYKCDDIERLFIAVKKRIDAAAIKAERWAGRKRG